MKEKYPDMELCVRTGIYLITKECNNASEAIDAANYAAGNCETGVKLYDEELKKQSDAEWKDTGIRTGIYAFQNFRNNLSGKLLHKQRCLRQE